MQRFLGNQVPNSSSTASAPKVNLRPLQGGVRQYHGHAQRTFPMRGTYHRILETRILQPELRPLRRPKLSERLDPPLIDVVVEDGYRHGDINRPEARFIVDEIKRLIETRTCGIGQLEWCRYWGINRLWRFGRSLRTKLGRKQWSAIELLAVTLGHFKGKNAALCSSQWRLCA